MNYTTHRRGAVQIVSINGVLDRTTAGTLYDVLIKCLGWRHAKLAVDLSRVTRITRAGSRGLIVAAKLASRTGGEMRICAATPMNRAFLRGLGFDPLLKLDKTLDEGLAVLLRGDGPHDVSGQSGALEVVMPDVFQPANDSSAGLRHLPVTSGA